YLAKLLAKAFRSACIRQLSRSTARHTKAIWPVGRHRSARAHGILERIRRCRCLDAGYRTRAPAPRSQHCVSRRKSPAIADGAFSLLQARRSSVNLDLAGRAWAEAVVEEELALLCERVLERLTRLELRVEKSFEELSRTVHVDVARIVE